MSVVATTGGCGYVGMALALETRSHERELRAFQEQRMMIPGARQIGEVAVRGVLHRLGVALSVDVAIVLIEAASSGAAWSERYIGAGTAYPTSAVHHAVSVCPRTAVMPACVIHMWLVIGSPQLLATTP